MVVEPNDVTKYVERKHKLLGVVTYFDNILLKVCKFSICRRIWNNGIYAILKKKKLHVINSSLKKPNLQGEFASQDCHHQTAQ